ncbi:MAG: hypothetical protein CRN43_21975 [Candidatus Nephrothrix sp. EaCA]|nr:MAG: hypothetical protein CRN43_21975 [Candidatus Nephrothrix sp. EaCA]
MIISNPIFDAPFGKLMENEKAVKFFIGSILGKQVSVALQSEELDDTDEPRLPVFCLYFIAAVRTKSGERKKVFVETRKVKKERDLCYFRRHEKEAGT